MNVTEKKGKPAIITGKRMQIMANRRALVQMRAILGMSYTDIAKVIRYRPKYLQQLYSLPALKKYRAELLERLETVLIGMRASEFAKQYPSTGAQKYLRAINAVCPDVPPAVLEEWEAPCKQQPVASNEVVLLCPLCKRKITKPEVGSWRY